jgi:NADH-quinone oxidoreductase subunit F
MSFNLTPVLTANWGADQSWTLGAYERTGGYQAVRQALDMEPDAVIQLVKDSGLRGRGGAGFPTGMKWGFIPQGDGKPHYLVVNADESEPGTCKDIPLMMATPHTLVEGVIISAYAIRANHAFIYVRGEVLHVARRLLNAVEEARAAGYIGANVLGKGFDLDVTVHIGAGAYICGEETALLESLEGFRGQPRLRPPFPAVEGLYACPTVINNVETISSVPAIVRGGAQWFRSMGTEKSPGFKIFSLSGHVTRPGQYEAPLGITLRELLDATGGIREGHELKFWTPGGSSTPLFTAEHLDVPLDFEGPPAHGSMLGTTALLDSLEGFRGQPRLRPPFPATHGLYGCPTVVNNVGTLASVPYIVLGGADWYKALGPEGSPGPCIYSLSGRVANPGQYEAPMGTTLTELLELAGGMSRGKALKFWTPGGSSTPIFTPDHLNTPLDFDDVAKAGSMNGTSAVMIFDEDDCVVRAVKRWSEFYAHESCGKCTPCREGTFWYVQIYERLENGTATEEDIETLLDLSDNILGRAFCALGDGATSPVTSSIQYFRDEYVAHFEQGGCPFDPVASTVFAGASAS